MTNLLLSILCFRPSALNLRSTPHSLPSDLFPIASLHCSPIRHLRIPVSALCSALCFLLCSLLCSLPVLAAALTNLSFACVLPSTLCVETISLHIYGVCLSHCLSGCTVQTCIGVGYDAGALGGAPEGLVQATDSRRPFVASTAARSCHPAGERS